MSEYLPMNNEKVQDKKTSKEKTTEVKSEPDTKISTTTETKKTTTTEVYKTVTPIDCRLALTEPELQSRQRWLNKYYTDPIEIKVLGIQFRKAQSKIELGAVEGGKHPDKCRYNDVTCIDATRVVLKDRPPSNDFIHANWVTTAGGYKYIATQGPLKATVEDFWHMVVTEGVKIIVMLCDFVETGAVKCEQYLPLTAKQEAAKHGNYLIRCRSAVRTAFPELVIRKIRVMDPKTKEIKAEVRHYQYLGWPDHFAPADIRACMYLYNVVKTKTPEAPAIVHCSAGIGRTATFIGIDYGIQMIERSPDVRPIEIILELRKQRAKSVQTHYQFVFLLIAISATCTKTLVDINPNLKDLIIKYDARMTKKTKKVASQEKDKKTSREMVKNNNVIQYLSLKGTQADSCYSAKAPTRTLDTQQTVDNPKTVDDQRTAIPEEGKN